MALWPRPPAAACAAAELTVRHAHALAKLGAGDEGLIAQALITVARLRRDLKAEHHDGPSPVRDPGNDSDQPRREISTAADCRTLAASDHATTAAIRPAPLRGSPRIATTMIPFSIFNAAADAVVSVPGRYQPNLIPGRAFQFPEETRQRAHQSRDAPRPGARTGRSCCPARPLCMGALAEGMGRRSPNACRRI